MSAISGAGIHCSATVNSAADSSAGDEIINRAEYSRLQHSALAHCYIHNCTEGNLRNIHRAQWEASFSVVLLSL